MIGSGRRWAGFRVDPRFLFLRVQHRRIAVHDPSETPFNLPRNTQPELPPARYAVQFAEGKGTVVYGEQCLAPQTCFMGQRWPAGS